MNVDVYSACDDSTAAVSSQISMYIISVRA